MPLPFPYKIPRDFDLPREKITAKQAVCSGSSQLIIDYLLLIIVSDFQ